MSISCGHTSSMCTCTSGRHWDHSERRVFHFLIPFTPGGQGCLRTFWVPGTQSLESDKQDLCWRDQQRGPLLSLRGDTTGVRAEGHRSLLVASNNPSLLPWTTARVAVAHLPLPWCAPEALGLRSRKVELPPLDLGRNDGEENSRPITE